MPNGAPTSTSWLLRLGPLRTLPVKTYKLLGESHRNPTISLSLYPCQPGAKDIGSYDVSDIEDYHEKHSKNLQVSAMSKVTPSPASTPAAPPPFKPCVKSGLEKQLDNWIEEKGTRPNFLNSRTTMSIQLQTNSLLLNAMYRN